MKTAQETSFDAHQASAIMDALREALRSTGESLYVVGKAAMSAGRRSDVQGAIDSLSSAALVATGSAADDAMNRDDALSLLRKATALETLLNKQAAELEARATRRQALLGDGPTDGAIREACRDAGMTHGCRVRYCDNSVEAFDAIAMRLFASSCDLENLAGINVAAPRRSQRRATLDVTADFAADFLTHWARERAEAFAHMSLAEVREWTSGGEFVFLDALNDHDVEEILATTAQDAHLDRDEEDRYGCLNDF